MDMLELQTRKPRISHVYMYDDRGSELYEQITKTEEYYPTHTELKLLQQHAVSIATFPPTELGPASETQTLCELGAGDGHKTLVLLTAMAAKAPEIGYAPIDVALGNHGWRGLSRGPAQDALLRGSDTAVEHAV